MSDFIKCVNRKGVPIVKFDYDTELYLKAVNEHVDFLEIVWTPVISFAYASYMDQIGPLVKMIEKYDDRVVNKLEI